MICFITKKIYSFISKFITIESKTLELVYWYGIELMVSSVINIVLILLISLLFSQIIEGVIFLLCFILLRQFTGGYHAKSYFSCNIIFALSFISVLWLSGKIANQITIGSAIPFIVTSGIIIIILSPISNVNKSIPKHKRVNLKGIAFTAWSFISIISLYLIHIESSFGVTVFVTVMLVTVLMLIEKLDGKGDKNEFQKDYC